MWIHQLWVLTLQTASTLTQALLEPLSGSCHPDLSLALEWTPIPDTWLPANLGIKEHSGSLGDPNSSE